MANKKEKGEVVSIDDEFGADEKVDKPIEDNADQPEAGVLPEEDKPTEVKEKATTTEALEAPEAPGEDVVSEQVSEQVDAAAETKKTWKDFGIDDFEGRSNEEIAAIVRQQREDIDFRRKIYAGQADELGALRKYKVEKEKPAEEKKPDIFDSMPDMTEGEFFDFNIISEKQPVKAVLKYARPVIEQLVQQQLQEAIQGGVKNTITESIDGQRDSIEYANFLSRHEDATTYESAMKVLDQPEYLGDQKRPYEELLGLAKLNAENSPLYAPVFQLMAKHPTISLKEANQLAKQQMGAVETAAKKKEKIQQNIDKIDTVNLSTTASAKSKTTGEIVTIDDEFEI